MHGLLVNDRFSFFDDSLATFEDKTMIRGRG